MITRDKQQDIRFEGRSASFENSDSKPRISVILPTYKRPDILGRTLSALETQSLGWGNYEVIVVDDGSGDSTEAILEEFSGTTECKMKFAVLRENGGPACARNVGLGFCRADIILIIGDDIEPDKKLVEKHLDYHVQNQEENYAVLGYVTYPDELESSEFMKWLEGDGRKYFFNYQDLIAGSETDYLHFYTCNVSVKKALLDKSGWFDESFPYASHEDLELGYRLSQSGMRLYYQPDAVGFHWHMLSVQGIARRVYLMGYSAVLFWKKVEDKGSPLRQLLRSMLARFASFFPCVKLWTKLKNDEYPANMKFPLRWHTLLFLSFFIGISDSDSRRAPRI